MGMSCLFQVRETDKPQPFSPPEWAYKYKSDEDIPFREHDLSSNFWWIETGGEGDCIHDTDIYRDELLKIAYGVWDHLKNMASTAPKIMCWNGLDFCPENARADVI